MNQKITPSREDRNLAKQIVKDANDARVKFGRTNGRVVLHVYVPNGRGFTIRDAADWADCPLNPETARSARRHGGDSAEREQEIMATEALIANHDAI